MFSKSKAPEKHLKEKVKQKTAQLTEVTLYLDEETMRDLARLKEIWSNAIPSCELSKIAKRAFKEALDKNDPVKKDQRREQRLEKRVSSSEQKLSTPVPGLGQTVKTQAPGSKIKLNSPAPGSKAEIKYQIRKRDQYQCTFVDERINERCTAKHFIEEDHIIPEALGGEYSVENLRLRCRTHNQRHAINTYGLKKMRFHMKSR